MLNIPAATATPVGRPDDDDTEGRSALRFRRGVLILAPTLAGVLSIGGALADPAVGLTGSELYEIYAAEPGAVQWKSVLYHFSYAFWGLAALMLAGVVRRRRGSWTANVAGILGFLGISSLPGFMIADFYDSAIGQAYGADGALAVEQAMDPMWGLTVMGLSGMVGWMLCVPVAALAAWRAGLVPWWAVAAPAVGIGAGMIALGATVPGWLVTTAGFVVLSVALARALPREA